MNRRGKLAYNAFIIIVAALAAMSIGAIILGAVGADILKAYLVILTEPLKDMIGITEIIVRAIPLSIIALGIAIAFRSGILNIGAEGQMMMGILASSAVAIALPGLPSICSYRLPSWLEPPEVLYGVESLECSGRVSASMRYCRR